MTRTRSAGGESGRKAASGAPAGHGRRTIKARLAGTSIHPDTLLATDYLNQYNDVVMMLEMAPFVPGMLEEAARWRPVSYEEHFERAPLRESELAVAAYRAAPEETRRRFDRIVAALDTLIPATVDIFSRLMEHPAAFLDEFEPAMERIREMHEELSDAIHGGGATLEQESIDELFEE